MDQGDKQDYLQLEPIPILNTLHLDEEEKTGTFHLFRMENIWPLD